MSARIRFSTAPRQSARSRMCWSIACEAESEDPELSLCGTGGLLECCEGTWLRDPAGQRGGLSDPRRELHLVERFVLADVEVAHVLDLGLAGGRRSRRRAAEEGHLDVAREG